MQQPKAPPRQVNKDGDERRVGVELEFAGLTVEETTRHLHAEFGGTVERRDAHRNILKHPNWGEATIELDLQYVHRNDREGEAEKFGFLDVLDFSDAVRARLGDALTGLVPVEIVFPPIAWSKLGELNAVFEVLRRHGALGTRESPLYAFGLHLNVEVATGSAAEILDTLRAYMVMADSLHEEVDVDLTRWVLPHADRFPDQYAKKICAPDYPAELSRMIDDYLEMNPTRNRELDMLPLFAHLDSGRVKARISDALVKPRPTYHYRLPNADLGDPDWSAATEWNRWVAIEELAEDKDRLKDATSHFLNEDRGLGARLQRYLGLK
ncbi:amidoligase family protein [Nisaea acidiphila]|uniref:Amidoligase family protein n=1 Tax=Nisaea acidiphila TaxID=1862145 RepID=A0A9J7ALW1_9PROT|nr:amidoligase family protein [Nisaea acidiphila]UUX48142.1 amidoligase family protein [Nisaea acidiphila]